MSAYKFTRKIVETHLTSTYLASYHRTDVLIKHIKPNTPRYQSFLKDFHAKTQLLLDEEPHPYITQLLDAWQDETGAYLVTAYHPSLADRLEKGERLSLAVIRAVVETIGVALDAIHHQQEVYGHLQPSMILAHESRDEFYLSGADAILTKYTLRPEIKSQSMGQVPAPQYQAPEVWNREWSKTALDIYSFGILLYELLDGLPPFDGTMSEIAYAHRHQPVPDLYGMVEGVHLEHFNPIIQKATAKYPQERYDYIMELVYDFVNVLNSVNVFKNLAEEALNMDISSADTVADPNLQRNTPQNLEHLRGHYSNLQLIDGGGMGSVYRGYHLELKQVVAVKVISARFEKDDQKIKRRFEKEIQALMALDHPHIIKVYEYGTQKDYYYTMEFVEGPSLEEYRPKAGPMSFKEVLFLMQGIADALDYAHDKHMIHRDIKPANIMLRPNQTIQGYDAVLMDFGLVKILDDPNGQLTTTGRSMGTWWYMAPEQMDDAAKVDRRADVYAFACVVYQLLTGKLPFNSNKLSELIEACLTKQPIDPRRYVSGIPEHAVNAIFKAMAKKADNRFDTVGAFMAALRG